MKSLQSFWQASLVGRAATALLFAAPRSATAKVLAWLSQSFLQLGRGSLLARMIQVDWGAARWLASSRLAQGLTLAGVTLEKIGIAGASKLQQACVASRVGQGVRWWQANQTRTARFWAGFMLGLAIGMVALGGITGTLTVRRRMAAMGLIPVGLLLFMVPVDFSLWIRNSRLLQLAYVVINQGAGEDT